MEWLKLLNNSSESVARESTIEGRDFLASINPREISNDDESMASVDNTLSTSHGKNSVEEIASLLVVSSKCTDKHSVVDDDRGARFVDEKVNLGDFNDLVACHPSNSLVQYPKSSQRANRRSSTRYFFDDKPTMPYEPSSHNSAILLVDISGFTKLSTILDAESLSKVILCRVC